MSCRRASSTEGTSKARAGRGRDRKRGNEQVGQVPTSATKPPCSAMSSKQTPMAPARPSNDKQRRPKKARVADELSEMSEVDSITDHRYVDGSLEFLVHWVGRQPSKAKSKEITSWCTRDEVGTALTCLQQYLKTTHFSKPMIDAILLDCKAATVFAAAGSFLELKRLSETPVPLHMPTTTFVATVKDVWLLELAASLQDVLPTDYIHGSACKKLVGCAKTLVDKPTATRIETFKDHLNNVLRARPLTWRNRAETYKDGLGYFSFDFFSDVLLRVLTSVHLQARWPGSPPVSRSQDLLTEEEVTELLSNPIFDGSVLLGAGRWAPLSNSFSSEATSKRKDSGRSMLVLPGEADTGRAVHPLFAKLHAIATRRLAAVESHMALRFPNKVGQFVESVRAGRTKCDTPPTLAREVLEQWCAKFDPGEETYSVLEGNGRDGTTFVWGCDVPHGGIQPSAVAPEFLAHTLRLYTAVELKGKRRFGKDSNFECHTGSLKPKLNKGPLRKPKFTNAVMSE